MDSQTPTPGPWIPWETPMIHQGKYYQCPVESGHADGIINVAIAFGVTIEECIANARLISEAPNLKQQLSERDATIEKLQNLLIEERRTRAAHEKIMSQHTLEHLDTISAQQNRISELETALKEAIEEIERMYDEHQDVLRIALMDTHSTLNRYKAALTPKTR